MRRLLLVRHAATASTRRSAFPVDEELDARGRAEAKALGRHLLGEREAISSPARRARQTAAAAGLEPMDEPALAECDFGRWRGRTLAEVHAADPEGVAAWMTDPGSRPHGGESLAELADRVGLWLDQQAELNGTAIAITHGGPVRAAVVRALGAPLEAFWRLDAAPLAITELHSNDGRWRVVRLNWRPAA